MNLEKKEEKIPSIYETTIIAAEKILKMIGETSWNTKMLLKSDAFLEDETYQRVLLDRIEFFTPKEELADTIKNLETLFLPWKEDENEGTLDENQGTLDERRDSLNEKAESEEMQILLRRKGRKGNPTKLFLEIRKNPYRIPFELYLIPFPDHKIFPQEKTRTIAQTKEDFIYYMFPPEEYLTFAFYEIIKELELIKNMSWYQDVYKILCIEPVNGRKFWESLNWMIKEYPIPSLENRIDTLKNYRDYEYMKKRWKSHCKKKKETNLQWEEVITLLVTFLTPVFEGVLKDQVFLEDWMPQLGRYLD